MNCPHCGKEITASDAAKVLRSIPSAARSEAARRNGKLGGRPKKIKTLIIGLDALQKAYKIAARENAKKPRPNRKPKG